MSYFWRPGADWGGGYSMMILADPSTPGQAFAGLDYGGIFTTTNSGSLWQGAMGGCTIKNGGVDNQFYSRAAAWSAKTPGKCYVGCAPPQNASPGNGFFGWVQNGARTLTAASNYGFGTTLSPSPASHRPRAAGRIIQVDFDSSSGTEYVYACMTKSGANAVVARTTDGNTFTDLLAETIRTDNAWKTACLVATDVLLVGSYRDITTDQTTQTGSTVWKITTGGGGKTIRNATAQSDLTITTPTVPGVVEDIRKVGSNVYAACGPYGVYSVTSSGATWTKVSGSFFAGKWVSSIDGDGTNLYVGCARGVSGGSSPATTGANILAKSTDGGSTWTWVSSSTVTHGTTGTTNSVPWGSPGGAEWWLLRQGAPAFDLYPGGASMDIQQVSVDASGFVYATGSAGAWLSKDGGASWRPSNIGLNGGEVTLVTPSGTGSAKANNTDYTDCSSTDHMSTGTRLGTAVTGTANAALAQQTDGTGNTYTLTIGNPPDCKRNGVSIADAFMRSTLHSVTDFKVSSDGYVYLTQNAGGVIVGDPSGAPVTDTTPPTAPTTISAVAGGASSITVTWSGATDNVAVTGFQVFRGGVQVAAPAASPYTDTGLTASTSYTYTVKAVDAAGNVSPASSTSSATTTSSGDTTPPTAPTTITAVASSSTTINLSWSGATDNTAVTGYQVYRNGTITATVSTLFYSDSGLAQQTSYTYTIKAFDAAGNLSPFSAGASAQTLAARTLIATLSGAATSYAHTGLQPSTTYRYVVTASDGAGNVSADSNTASATTPAQVDTIPPTAPGSLVATPTQTTINLAWTQSTDNVAVTSYRVYRDGSLLTSLAPTTTYIDVTGQPGVLYFYHVTALDGAGNESGDSNTASASYPVPPANDLAIRSQHTYDVAGATSVTFAPPTGTQPGDIVIAVLRATCPAQTLGTVQMPAGWTSQGGASRAIVESFGWVAYNTNQLSYTWTWANAATGRFSVFAITGTDTVNVFDSGGTSGPSTSPFIVPHSSITLANGGDMMLLFGWSPQPVAGTAGPTLADVETPRTVATGLSIFTASLSGMSSGLVPQIPTNLTGPLNIGTFWDAVFLVAGTPVIVDTPPTLTVTSPVDGQTLTGTSVTVQAQTSDADGIGEVDVSVNGGAFVPMNAIAVDAAGNGTYGLTVTLTTDVAPGAANTIDVQSTDAAPTNNATASAPTITVNAITPSSDSTGPTITWSQPPSGNDLTIQGANGLDFTITGIATDASGVNNIRVTNPDATVSTIGVDQNGNFSYDWNLATGTNAFTVVATDSSPAANTTTKSFTITLAAPDVTDTTGPTLAVTSPAADQTVHGSAGTQYNVTGTAVDPSGIASVTVNSLAVAFDASSGDFSTTITLAAGSNTVTVVATDASAGSNTTTVTHTITLSAVVGPTLVVTAPAGNVVVTGDSPYLYQVTGTVSSSNGIGVVTVNGMAAPVASDGSWSILADLSPGPNTLTITATDTQAPVAGQTTIVRVVTLETPQGGFGDAFNLSSDQARIAERIQERGLE